MALGIVLVICATVVGNLFVCHARTDDQTLRASRTATRVGGVVGRGPVSSDRPDMPRDRHHGSMRLEGQVIDEQDRPVAGATVAMFDPPDISTTTEADGSFVFESIAAGGYSVLAVKDNLVGDAGVDVRAGNEPLIIRVHRGPTVVIRAVDAETRAPVASAHVRTWGHSNVTDGEGVARVRGVWASNPRFEITADHYEPATLGVRPTDDAEAVVNKTVELHRGAPVSGIVVSPTREPVADARVVVASVEAGWSGVATSDAKGAWHFDALAAGTHLFTATSEIYAASPELDVELDGKAASTGIVVHLDYGGQLVGTVVDAEGKPVGDATVLLDWEAPQGRFGSLDATSDADGKFSFLGTPFGTYRVWAKTAKGASLRTAVNLVKNQRVDVRLVVEAGDISGAVVDSKGQPVPDVEVTASTNELNGPIGVDETDRRGAFEIRGLPPGDYGVSGHDGGGGETEAVTVRPGAPPIKLVLKQPASIAGRVVLDGHPVPYYGISWAGPWGSWSQHPTPVRSTDGRFKLDGVPAGTWTLIVSGPGFAQKQVNGINVDEHTVDIGDIVVAHGISIRGHVYDASGAAVPGATVAVHRLISYDNEDDPLNQIAQGVFNATTDGSGAYRFSDITPSDSERDQNRIFASHPTLGVAAEQSLPTQGGVVDLALTAFGAIDGVVQGGSGLVTATRSGGDSSEKQVETDAAGKFRFEQVLPGEYVVALSWGFARPVVAAVVPNGRASVTIVVPAVKALVVIHAERGNCDGVSLKAADATSEQVRDRASALCEGGEGVIADVPPGQYQACVDDSCVPCVVTELPARQDVRVPAKP